MSCTAFRRAAPHSALRRLAPPAARLAPILLTLAGALAATPSTAWAFRAGGQPPARPALDARAGTPAPVPARVASARALLERRLGAQATVATDRTTGGLRLVAATDHLLTQPARGADPAGVALDYVRAHLDAFGLDATDLAALRLTDRSTSPEGITHLVWRQAVDGVPAYDSQLVANVAADGRLVSIGGAPVHALAVPSTDPPLGPAAARAVAQRDVGATLDGDPGSIGAGPQRPTTFAGGDRARLTVVADPGGDHLAWRLTVAGTDPYIYDVLVDAATGAVLARHSLTAFALAANALEAHPGAAAGGTPQPVSLAPYFAPGATPSSLDGLYAHAYADLDDSDTAGPGEDVAPTNGDFTFTTGAVAPAAGQACPTAFATPCTWDGSSPSSAAPNRAQAVTQLFWFVNRFHDWLAQPPIGFTAGSGNFEGADAVHAEADDAGGINNANMSTPPDGSPPRMQMYLFGAPFPAVDGDFDATVVYHEYTHGLSNRLVGGDGMADGLYARQSQAMGEGWSDWYAMDYLVEQGLVSDTTAPAEVVVGAYVTDDNLRGIRENALDCPVGASATACPGTASAGSGGFTFADLGRVVYAGNTAHPYFEVHADGEIWAETLWDLRRALGGATARNLITSAMRLSPKNPSFLDMRDAILQADLVGGGAHREAIWSVFATRGMGYGATTASANATHAVASFATPPLASAGAVSVSSPVPLGDGDRALEPGEAARLRFTLTNPGAAPLTGVRATLNAVTPGVFVGQPAAGYGTIAPGATAAADQPFAITVPAGAACGSLVSLALAVTTDQGAFSVPVTVPLESGRATTTKTYTSPVAIPDGAPGGGIASTLSIAGPGRIDRLRVTLAITHAWMGDLHAWLRSPAGTVVDLLENPGLGAWGSATNLSAAAPLVLDDEAAGLVQDVDGPDSATTSGALRPNEPLARFAGEDRAGTWTLRVVDTTSPDAGSISSWSIETDEATCAATGPALPVAATDAPTGAVGDAATLRGQVDAGGAATQAVLEYGTTTAYGTRTAPQLLAPAGGSQPFAATVSGLAPGTTYHVRALALRDGTVVTAGEDRTFVAGADAAEPGASTATTTAPITTTTTAAKRPLPRLITFPRTAKVDRRGRAVVAFTAAPPRAPGAIAVLPLRGGRGLAAARFFTTPASGRVRLRLTLTATARRALRHSRRTRARVRILVGGRAFHRTITLRRAP